MLKTTRLAILALVFSLSLSACSTIVSTADAVVSTAVDVTAGAIKTTGKVIGKAVDKVTPGSD